MERKQIGIRDLKVMLINFYYPETKQDKKRLEDEIKRELIITHIYNNYGSISTVVASMNGSPPKGEAIIKCNSGIESPNMILIGMCGKISKEMELIEFKEDLLNLIQNKAKAQFS